MANDKLNQAKDAKMDEFYTQLSDIENELRHYKEHFKGKTVLCNCDDPRVSNFFRYFSLNFEHLGLKKLICTCYKSQNADLFSENDSEQAVYTIYEGDKNGNSMPDKDEVQVYPLQGDGDFRSDECIELLKEADIVCTNPPFSLFREYVAQLVKYDKKFIIIGTMNAIHYSEIFPLIRDNKIWCGYNFNKTLQFAMPESYTKFDHINEKGEKIGKVPCIVWFTNLDTKKKHEDFVSLLYKTYSPEEYTHYENFDGIDVGSVKEIPNDYFGYMGVPDSFLDVYNPDQFEIIGIGSGELAKQIGVKRNYRGRSDLALIKNGKPSCPYSRIIIRRK